MDPVIQPLPSSLAGKPPQQWIAGPSPVYLTGEELLRITTIANLGSLVVTVAGRVLRPDNTIAPFQFTHVPNSNRTVATTVVALPEGWLLGAVAKVTSGSPSFGAVWGSLELVRGAGSAAIAVQSLANDFISANAPLMWPGSANVDPLEGAGNLRSITGTTPGAGAEVSETVPTGARWELISFWVQLITAVAVANRVVELIFDDGTLEYFRAGTTGNQAASITGQHVWTQGLILAGFDNVALWPGYLPFNNRLGAGHRIRTKTNNIQGADQHGPVQYLVREWFDA